jgi:mRNA-degrading endonuclease toxin of MazEF toxin-antitoxin module
LPWSGRASTSATRSVAAWSASALNLDNVNTVPKALLTSRITHLRAGKLTELCVALNIAAGC